MGVLVLKSQLQIIKNSQNNYNKPHLNFQEQLEHMKSCGLNIHNESYAIKKLSTINYYRLSAYCLTFQYPKNSEYKNKFYPNTEFRAIIRLYDFDRHLRHLLFGAVEVVEVYIRTQIAYWHTKKHGAFGYLEEDEFHCTNEEFTHVMKLIKSECGRSDEKFIEHFKEKYETTDLPLWTVVEVLSLGTLSKLFMIMKKEDKDNVCQIFGVHSTKVFQSWIHSLTIIRNISAHHSRLWNKQLRIPFKVPNKNRLFQPIAKITKKIKGEQKEFNNNGSTFFTIFALKYMLDRIGEEVEFKDSVESLLKAYPEINLKAMGFLDNWQSLDIWDGLENVEE